MYHCDLQLPATTFNHLVSGVVNVMNECAARLCDRIITHTEDFASNSLFLRRYESKVRIIPPPVLIPAPAPMAQESLIELRSRGPVIGMAARFAAEKGVEVLLDAVPRILERFPDARFAFTGQYENVLGEAHYYARLKPRIDELIRQGRWVFFGVLPQDQMAHYFRALDVLVVPSLNSTESFGLVQIEAMMVGTPVVASNLPGVRQPVRLTGMGKVVSVGDPHELAEGIIGVLTSQPPQRTQQNPALARFAPSETAAQYEKVLADLGVRVEQ
jgi:glycosyltransferase involved in cell wall biosynthesis